MTEEQRSNAILSALSGLNVRDARNFLYKMEERLETAVLATPAPSSADAALMRMAEQLGENP